MGEGTFLECYSLEKVTCLAKDVPNIGNDCFEENREILYVVEEVLENYKNSDWAQYFSQIFPLSTNGVDSLIYNNEFDTYKIFDLKGTNVLNTKNRSDINNLPSGIYIINGKKVVIGK